MVEGPVITAELKRLVGVESEPVVYEIEKGMISRFAEATEDSNPLWQDIEKAKKTRYKSIIAPPTFLASLRHEMLFHQLLETESPLKRLLNGGNELEYFSPVRPGDVITVTGKLANQRERGGKAGTMLFMIVEMTYKNQKGEIVAKGRNTIIRY